MKSAVIDVSIPDEHKALDLVERTARKIGYPDDIAQKIRLMTEELITGNRTLIEDLDASLWVETNDHDMEIHLKLTGGLSSSTRKNLIELSQDKCKAPREGIFARIGDFFTDTFMENVGGYIPVFMVEGESNYGFPEPYSLLKMHSGKYIVDYKGMDPKDKDAMMEIADDVTVCAFKDGAELVVVKELPKVKAKVGAD